VSSVQIRGFRLETQSLIEIQVTKLNMAFSIFNGADEDYGSAQAAGCSLPRPVRQKLNGEKAALSAKQKVLVIHAAVNLAVNMHETESDRKYFLQLFACFFKNDASLRFRRVRNPRDPISGTGR
jgi:hypothetical protein